MKQIKFRGINKRGDVVFGAGVKTTEYDYDILLQNPKECELIQKNTAAQFVGYDKNGEEIYSDDEILVKDWSRHCMAGTGIEIAGDYFKIAGDYFNFNDIGQKFDNVELVKEN